MSAFDRDELDRSMLFRPESALGQVFLTEPDFEGETSSAFYYLASSYVVARFVSSAASAGVVVVAAAAAPVVVVDLFPISQV